MSNKHWLMVWAISVAAVVAGCGGETALEAGGVAPVADGASTSPNSNPDPKNSDDDQLGSVPDASVPSETDDEQHASVPRAGGSTSTVAAGAPTNESGSGDSASGTGANTATSTSTSTSTSTQGGDTSARQIEATNNGAGEVRVEEWIIGPHRRSCSGMMPQECLQVKDSPGSDWQNHYDGIDGFVHEDGTTYRIKVELTPIPNPPADASSVKYRLLEILSQE